MAEAQPTLTSPIEEYLRQIHRECQSDTSGAVATYIPELGKANPDWFGIVLVTATGSVYAVGDSEQHFTIQSISKPFVYGLALEDQGREAVLKRVGVEPTGDAFNSISLEPGSGRPRNPMINAGAIATAGMIEGKSETNRFNRVLEMFGRYAGRELTLDESVYRSESETGHRNRAIGHMLRNFDILTSDPIPVTELYFKQCSISVTCRDLAVMAATLANRGVNPLTGKQAIRGEYVESVLSVMETCGMYNFAGQWMYEVGMPAKSGVAGGVIAVLPGQLGIGVFSPRLDAQGNSVRGIRVCQQLSRHLDLHLLSRPTIGQFTIRVSYHGGEFGSSRSRTNEELAILRNHGEKIRAWQLQGNLAFSTTEVVIRDLLKYSASTDYFILDLKRVLSLNESACHLLHDFLRRLKPLGKQLVFTNIQSVPLLRRFMHIKLGEQFPTDFCSYADNDIALEWCENQLLDTLLTVRAADLRASPETFDALSGLETEELKAIVKLLKPRRFEPGDTIIQAGANADEVFFLVSGTTSVTITLQSGQPKRIAGFAPGMTFGEMAIIDRAPRSANVAADSKVECLVLSLTDFDALDKSQPRIKAKLLQNLCHALSSKLRKANRELSVFD